MIDTTSTEWEPDWDALIAPFIDQASQLRQVVSQETAQAIIANYRDQLAASGLVVASRRDLRVLTHQYDYSAHDWGAAYQRVATVTAAQEEQS